MSSSARSVIQTWKRWPSWSVKVSSGVARPQPASQCFAGGVEIGHQRVEPEPALVGRCRSLFLGVRADQRGVEVDHVEPRIHPSCPRLLTGLGAGYCDLLQHGVIDGLEGSPRRRVRRHVLEQAGLVTQHRQIRGPGAAISDHHRQIPQHLTPVVTPTTLLGRSERIRQPDRQADVVGQVRHQPSTGMVHEPSPAPGHHQPFPTASAIHSRSALLSRVLLASSPTESLARRAASRISPYTTTGLTEQSGLVLTTGEGVPGGGMAGGESCAGSTPRASESTLASATVRSGRSPPRRWPPACARAVRRRRGRRSSRWPARPRRADRCHRARVGRARGPVRRPRGPNV